ncbi:DUF5919 domain-containing protein [Nocardia brasiliensis]|uniref:DUF5919 domain-containing protein n=1 Tax=Nocardia brasiliensis TaxID=37326 RepID=UPI002454E0CF|nr:DUF5919 domain-containing protein [Nocardia brasiliensis]
MGTVLKALLRQRHIQTLAAFRREYNRVAIEIGEPELVERGPQKAQFYRWQSGEMSGYPQPHHCRVLIAMCPGWTVPDLFAQYSGDPNDLVPYQAPAPAAAAVESSMADVEAVYATRLHFMRAMPPEQLLSGAQRIDMAGLSLNMLCQQYADSDIVDMLARGTRIRCLFLDPAGTSIRDREREEGHPPGLLTNLTDTNIRTLERIRAKAGAGAALDIRVYDTPIRFNITLIDDQLCVMQPYMPAARGVESPTFVARRSGNGPGIYKTFRGVFDTMWATAEERQIDG